MQAYGEAIVIFLAWERQAEHVRPLKATQPVAGVATEACAWFVPLCL